jgi:hypothetical protein
MASYPQIERLVSIFDDITHLFYPKGCGYRSLCGIETIRDAVKPPCFSKSCVSCNVAITEANMPDDVKMSGAEPELTEEEYAALFNRSVREGMEMTYTLPATKDLSPEALVDHVNLLSAFALRVRIAKQAAKVTLEQKRIHLDKEQREALRLRDMQYKPVVRPKEDDDSKVTKPRRAAGTAKKDDAITQIMKLMGMSRDAAEKFLAAVGDAK